MKRGKQIIAEIDPILHKRLKVRLARDGCSYRQWLEDRIVEFLSGPNKGGSHVKAKEQN